MARHSLPWAVASVRSKWLFRLACASAGLPTPRFHHIGAPAAAAGDAGQAARADEAVCVEEAADAASASGSSPGKAGHDRPASPDRAQPSSEEEQERLLAADLAASGVRFPIVVKPCGCAGSFSVTRADDVRQLADAVRAYRASLPDYLARCSLSAASSAATGEAGGEPARSGGDNYDGGSVGAKPSWCFYKPAWVLSIRTGLFTSASPACQSGISLCKC